MTDMEMKELIELRGLQKCKVEDIAEELYNGFCVTEFRLNKPNNCNWSSKNENCFNCWKKYIELELKEKKII